MDKTSQTLNREICAKHENGAPTQNRQDTLSGRSHYQPEPSHPLCPSPHADFFSENPHFERKIASLIRVYSKEVCEQPVMETSKHYPIYREWLIDCLRFHTEQVQTVQTGEMSQRIDEVIRSLQEGRSTGNETALGGNPLRDGVLAVALLVKDANAITMFEKDYHGYLKGIAFRVHPVLGNDPDEWWNEFLDFLAGYSHTNGKLKKYQGKCALRLWLRVVLWNFLRRRPIPLAAPEIAEDVAMTATEESNLELSESIALFTDLVRDSLQALSDRDRLLLSMIYIDNLLKKEIAALFQVHPGQISRREDIALEKLRTELRVRLENLPRKDLHEEVIGGIVSNPKEFSEALIGALGQLCAKERG